MRYRVRCVAPGDGAVREECLDAADAGALRLALQARGMVVLSVRQDAVSAKARRSGAYALFCREVRTLVQAGMTVVEAVDTLCARQSAQGAAAGLAEELRERLLQGQSLSASLAGLGDAPAVLVAAVKAGERTSNLVEALDDYLRFETLVQQLRRKVISASIYPALVTVLGIGISIFLLMVVMPNFARMYQNLHGQATGLNAFVIEASQVISAHRGATLVVLALLTLAAAWWQRSGKAPAQIATMAFRVRWMRARIEDFQLAMLYQAIALLLKGGYPLAEAMQIAGAGALSAHLRAAVDAARCSIEAGAPVAASLQAHGLCDEVDRRLMAAAERNGDFHLAADVVARMHGERFELFVERATRIVEPVLLLGVALMVGSIVVMMYLPVFDMATRLR